MKTRYGQMLFMGLIVIFLISFMFFNVPFAQTQSFQIWSNPINLSNAGSSTSPAFVIDASGTIHVIWFDRFDGYKYTKSTDGVDWTSAKPIHLPFSPLTPINPDSDSKPIVPLLIADKNGGVHVLWLDSKNALYYSKVSSDFDVPYNWTSTKKLADSVIDFSATISTQGILHIGFVSNLSTESAPAGVYYLQLNAGHWSQTQSLYSSQYFRSLKPEEANIQLAVSEKGDLKTVYIAWDDRPQKRILLSKSLDGGSLWEKASLIQDSQDSSGLETPFNVNIGVFDSKVLLLWQSGIPGAQCLQYSQWSTDGAKHFNSPVKILDEIIGCPQSSNLIMDKDLSVALLGILDDISLVAWNGSEWSKPQTQNEVTTFINSKTLDSVILGCQQTSSYLQKLFLVGCDNGNSGDIWFRYRSIGSIKDWFPDSLTWSAPAEITNVNQQIRELSSISDNENNIHTFWVQTPLLAGSEGIGKIQYARWNDNKSSNPVAIMPGLNGSPMQFKVKADHQNRLLLTWVDRKTGDILFSWAQANRANKASEWGKPQYIPSVSQVNSSPDILTDASGRILVVYAIPVNEKRGIYFVESYDGGSTWSQPYEIFDAVSAGWDLVDQPNITLTGDGRLHILFSRYSLQGERRQSLGLYYSQSANGGVTWSDLEAVSELSVPWSKLVGYDKSTLHRLWQEYNQSTLVSFHQISQDSGVTWSRPIIVSSVSTTTSLTTQTIDLAGNLYFLQLTGKDNQMISGYKWNGLNWSSQVSKVLYIKEPRVLSSIAAGVSSKGHLLVSILVDYSSSLTEELESDILSTGISLGLPDKMPTPYPAVIATAEPSEIMTGETPNTAYTVQPSAPVSSITSVSDFPSSSSKNLVGFLLLGGILGLISIILWPISRKRANSKRLSQ